MKHDLRSMTRDDMTALMAEWGQPAFRAKQLFGWIHQKRVADLAQMHNLPRALRASLAEKCSLTPLNLKKRLVSSIDGTVKYLYGLSDGNTVESVLMRYRHGNSLCISTQVGCRMNCGFCASTIGGLQRNLTPGEMLGEVYGAAESSGERVGSIVLMGIGEPLDNYENVVRFLRILSDPEGLGLSPRHVSLSTCGLVDGIAALAAEKLPVTLSVSLHAPNDTLRDELMPINKKWNIAALMAACRDYFAVTGRRVSFEYALIEGVNDAPAHAQELAALLDGMNCHVNLIPHNTVSERSYRRPNRDAVRRFQDMLTDRGVNATVRRELGSDILAACGQLRREDQQN